MKIKSATFETSAPDLKSCPNVNFPEFALIGRSNVGKSSLVNTLCSRRDLAKTSGTPGKTKLLNFFKINGNWFLVDLPGYGYAKVANRERFDFNETVANYIQNRENLKGVFVLVDSSIPPQKIDLEFMRWLVSKDKAFILVRTKIDRQSPTATRKNAELLDQALLELFGELPDSIQCSSKTGEGKDEMLRIIEAVLSQPR